MKEVAFLDEGDASTAPRLLAAIRSLMPEQNGRVVVSFDTVPGGKGTRQIFVTLAP